MLVSTAEADLAWHAELAIVVEAPTPHMALLIHCIGSIAATGNVHYAGVH